MTTASRLQRTPLGDLHARIALAETSLQFSQTSDGRKAAVEEIEQIRAELQRRGYQPEKVDA